uniref:Uncharacterized protein n=1 Tax=Amphora coffeiformis TaxID=265554 RepID=A0A6S8I5E6_9STRA
MVFSWMWKSSSGGGDNSFSSTASDEASWLGPSDSLLASGPPTTTPLLLFYTDETPGTLLYFQQFQQHLESQLTYPDPQLPVLWTDTLQGWDLARQSLQQAQKILDDLQKHPDTAKPEQIAQAQKAVQQAQSTVDEYNHTLDMVGESLLTTTTAAASSVVVGQDDKPSIPLFLSTAFDDSAWITYTVLQNPQQWANYCCSSGKDNETPDPTRVARALHFLGDVAAQRRILAEGGGGGGPRGGNYGGYLDILETLDSSSARYEPVLERLVHAVALEFANGDLNYFDTQTPIDPLARFLHYEQAFLMGDLDPAFSSFSIWELRCAVNSPQQDWELAWGRECLQTYRPDWALTDDVQWRYCRLVRLDVDYKTPEWTSWPRSMDQALSGGGKCGPRAWFGRFMCQAFGIPIWGVRQPGHAAMSRWTKKGWMVCLGAGFDKSWWEDRCGDDFKLETMVRDRLPSPVAYLQQVMRLEWLAKHQKESNTTILKTCAYDPNAPWYALSLVQRRRLSKLDKLNESNGRETHSPCSTRIIPKLLHVQTTAPNTKGLVTCCSNGACIPADTTATSPSNKVLIMPSFSGGRQLFLGADAIVDYALEDRWLPPVQRKYRLTVKMATAHAKDAALLVTVIPKGRLVERKDKKSAEKLQEVGDCYRLPLPYTKGLWGETQSIDITLSKEHALISLQREWNEKFGVALKEIRLEPC